LAGGPLVEARGLRKVYPDGTVAVDGVDLEAGRGVTVLMGPNGSGKTTTLMMIAGALMPGGGVVRVCGHDMWRGDWARPRSCVGFAPQNMPFREKLTVIENLTWYGMIRGLGPGEARRRGRRLLEEVGLEGVEGRKVAQLSGGMRRRLAIAAALIGDPEVVILDEPTSGLDPAARRRLWGLLGRLAKDRAVVASTHIPEEAEEHADIVYIFHRGRVAARGRPGELVERHAPLSRIVVRGARITAPREVGGARLLAASEEEASYAAHDPDRALPRLVEALLSGGREAAERRG
jgi:ABC-type multidrug transport system ATPase subunit